MWGHRGPRWEPLQTQGHWGRAEGRKWRHFSIGDIWAYLKANGIRWTTVRGRLTWKEDRGLLGSCWGGERGGLQSPGRSSPTAKQPISHTGPHLQRGPTFDCMLCCHHLEIHNNFLTRSPTFSFYTEPLKLCRWSWPRGEAGLSPGKGSSATTVAGGGWRSRVNAICWLLSLQSWKRTVFREWARGQTRGERLELHLTWRHLVDFTWTKW